MGGPHESGNVPRTRSVGCSSRGAQNPHRPHTREPSAPAAARPAPPQIEATEISWSCRTIADKSRTSTSQTRPLPLGRRSKLSKPSRRFGATLSPPRSRQHLAAESFAAGAHPAANATAMTPTAIVAPPTRFISTPAILNGSCSCFSGSSCGPAAAISRRLFLVPAPTRMLRATESPVPASILPLSDSVCTPRHASRPPRAKTCLLTIAAAQAPGFRFALGREQRVRKAQAQRNAQQQRSPRCHRPGERKESRHGLPSLRCEMTSTQSIQALPRFIASAPDWCPRSRNANPRRGPAPGTAR